MFPGYSSAFEVSAENLAEVTSRLPEVLEDKLKSAGARNVENSDGSIVFSGRWPSISRVRWGFDRSHTLLHITRGTILIDADIGKLSVAYHVSLEKTLWIITSMIAGMSLFMLFFRFPWPMMVFGLPVMWLWMAGGVAITQVHVFHRLVTDSIRRAGGTISGTTHPVDPALLIVLLAALMVLLVICYPVCWVVHGTLSKSSLHHAAYGGSAERVGRIAEEHPELLEARDRRGFTPLHSATDNDPWVTLILLDCGADIEARSDLGNTALQYAILPRAHSGVMEVLIAWGADVNTRNDDGETPLHTACDYRNSHAVDLLIAAGADVDVPDNRGRTPLHTATIRRFVVGVQTLTEAGADVNVRDSEGRTPLYYARSRRSQRLYRIIKEHGGRE